MLLDDLIGAQEPLLGLVKISTSAMAATGVGCHASRITDRRPLRSNAIEPKNLPVQEFQIPMVYLFPVW